MTAKLLLGILAGLIIGIAALIALNYFNILSLPAIFPKQQKKIDLSQPAIRINDKVISYKQYQDVLSFFEYALKDKKAAQDRTTNLFIERELLKTAAQNQGKPFQEEEFQQYLKQQGFMTALNSAQQLELETAYLKNELFDALLNWYSGQYFVMRFENSLPISAEEKKKRAKAKIDQIRNKLVNNSTFRQVIDAYIKDPEVEKLNDGQGFAGTFEKMSIGNPTVTAPELLQTLPKMQLNEVSEVMIFSDPKRQDNGNPIPFAYGIVKLTDASKGTADSYNQWLQDQQNQAKITIYNIDEK